MTSSSNRDLPTPGSPGSPRPAVPSRTCSSKPDDGRELRLPPDEWELAAIGLLDPDRLAHDRRPDRLGFALGGEGRDRRRLEDVREWSRTISVARIWPASALLITRAAVLIASPKTRYARRYGGPKSPVKTLPVLTPTRIGTMPGRSMIAAQRAEHPLLVVPRAGWGPGREQGFDARLADVRLVEGDLVAEGLLLDR